MDVELSPEAAGTSWEVYCKRAKAERQVAVQGAGRCR